jgi:hypothetical protein
LVLGLAGIASALVAAAHLLALRETRAVPDQFSTGRILHISITGFPLQFRLYGRGESMSYIEELRARISASFEKARGAAASMPALEKLETSCLRKEPGYTEEDRQAMEDRAKGLIAAALRQIDRAKK